jgi:hypothetical protein
MEKDEIGGTCSAHRKITGRLFGRIKVLTAVKMSMLVFLVVTSCEFVGRYRRFGKYTVSIFRAEDDWYLPTSPQGLIRKLLPSHLAALGSSVNVIMSLFIPRPVFSQ